MTLPQFLRGAARIIACVTAVGALVIAGRAALLDQTATASAAGAVGLALMVLAALDLESFEGLGIKAQLRSTLSDAENKVKELDKITIALAKSAFMQSAKGILSHKERSEIVADLTAALEASKLDPGKIEEIKAPFYRYLAYNYWYALGYLRSMYQAGHANYIQQLQMRTQAGPQNDALAAEHKRLSENPESEFPTENNFHQLRDLLLKMVAKYPLAKPEDRSGFEAAASDLADMFEACVKKGNYTHEALMSIEQLRDANSPAMRKLRARLSVPGA